MLNLNIIKDPHDRSQDEAHPFLCGQDMVAFLKLRFGEKFPDNAKLYENEIRVSNEITPKANTINEDIDRILNLQGEVWLIFEAKFGGLLVGVILPLISGIAQLLFKDKPPTPVNRRASSPNNGLSERVNQVRLSSRVPDIYGEIRATPDLIAAPNTRYIDHR